MAEPTIVDTKAKRDVPPCASLKASPDLQALKCFFSDHIVNET
jgi:hypothetical protein